MNSTSHEHLLRLLTAAARQQIPWTVSIELTRACNFRCRHCYQASRTTPHALTFGQITTLLRDLRKAGTMEVAFTGGEVLLHRDWQSIVLEARRLGFQVRVLTNGSLIDRSAAEFLKDQTISVEISLYAVEPEVFEEMTQRPGSFPKTMGGIEHLLAAGVDISAKMPVCKINASHVDQVAAFCAERGIRFGTYATLLPKSDGTPQDEDLVLSDKETRAFFCNQNDLAQSAENADEILDDQPLCAAGIRYAFIDTEGEVYACNLIAQSAGNVTEQSFETIWANSPVLQRIRSIRKTDLTPCGSCDDLAVCGRCHALAFLEKGDMTGPSDSACRRAQALRDVKITVPR